MRARILIPILLALSGCGLEAIFANIGHLEDERPASKLSGKLRITGPGISVAVADADGKVLEPFLTRVDADAGTYELRLPSSKYSNLVLTERAGNTALRALVPSIGEESALTVDIDDRSTAEALIAETRLSADKSAWKKVTPETYVATRTLIRAGFDQAGSATAELLKYVNLLITGGTDVTVSGDPVFFNVPVATSAAADGGTPVITITSSPLDNNWLDQTRFDYVGDGRRRSTSADFDAKLAQVAALYRPSGCPDPNNIRIMFTVNFNAGIKNGNCGVSDRFKWATDKPGKSMFFVGWIHKDSPYQDANFNPPTTVNALIGAGVPNTLPMHDDGQGGDEVAGDNIWTIYFDVPRGLRMGFKYTWGTAGAVWTGSEEWPGNSRIIEAVDVNGDDIVYRRDVFGDEATNKDLGNLNQKGTGQITWDTVLRPGWGIEAREQPVDVAQTCKAADAVWVTPASIAAKTLACQ